jgi:hypothetical protein
MKLQFIRKYIGPYEWKKFARKTRIHGQLLSSLPSYPGAILVTGCQRSGTTLVTRLLVQSAEINEIWTSNDDEYDAAMILSGNRQIEKQGRYCFQTTYLNEAYKEYIDNKDLPFQLVWVLRDPLTVVNSMLYNWRRFPLNELYKACGEKHLNEFTKQGVIKASRLTGPTALEKASLSYVDKQRQLFELKEHFTDDRLLIINYESIVNKSSDSVPLLFRYANLGYSADCLNIIKNGNNKPNMVNKNKRIIEDICMSTYQSAKALAAI